MLEHLKYCKLIRCCFLKIRNVGDLKIGYFENHILYGIEAKVVRHTGATTKGWGSLFVKASVYGVFLPFAIGAMARLYAGESYAVAIAAASRRENNVDQYMKAKYGSLELAANIISSLF